MVSGYVGTARPAAVAGPRVGAGGLRSPSAAMTGGRDVRAVASAVGNRAMGALLQRYTVVPTPIIHRQFLMWRDEAKVLDLNCGWYSQLAAVDHVYMKKIRQGLTDAQRQQLEANDAPHLSYEAGRRLMPYENAFILRDFGYAPDQQPNGLTHSLDISQVPGNNLEEKWDTALERYGPLIVSGPFGEPFGVPHYVTVVGLEQGQLRYLDALTFFSLGGRGTTRYAPLTTMAPKIASVEYVDVAAITALFARRFAAAAVH